MSEQNRCFFIQLSIIDQLKAMFSQKGFYNDLLHRFSRKKKYMMDLEDIYDGSNYQQHMKDGKFYQERKIFHLLGILMESLFLNPQITAFGPYI